MSIREPPAPAPPDRSASAPILDIAGLTVSFSQLRRRITVIEDLDLSVPHGATVGLVGESGSGKSVTALAIMGLLGEQGRIERGSIRLAGRDLARLDRRAMLGVRGREIAMIFQEPMTSLNPVYTVGFQIAEVLIRHLGLVRRAARSAAVELMAEVGIPAPALRAEDYPHQLSGGMRQRVMIAMAMACRPKLLIADEPTTALDVTIQAQILDLMRRLQRETGAAMLLITHDLGLIAGMADRVAVMYAGRLVEQAPVHTLFAAPRHPYTRLLLRSVPRVRDKRRRLQAIQGTTPPPSAFPAGCRFHPRCPDAAARCTIEAPVPDLVDVDAGHWVRCWRWSETDLASMEGAA